MTNIPKIITSFWLAALLTGANGCLTYVAVRRAEGYTAQPIQPAKGDKIIKCDQAADGTCWIIPAAQGEDVSHMSVPHCLPESARRQYRLYQPNHAYYALLPLTIPADAVLTPLVILFALHNEPGRPSWVAPATAP